MAAHSRNDGIPFVLLVLWVSTCSRLRSGNDQIVVE
jgi:hypothetical protein